MKHNIVRIIYRITAHNLQIDCKISLLCQEQHYNAINMHVHCGYGNFIDDYLLFLNAIDLNRNPKRLFVWRSLNYLSFNDTSRLNLIKILLVKRLFPLLTNAVGVCLCLLNSLVQICQGIPWISLTIFFYSIKWRDE